MVKLFGFLGDDKFNFRRKLTEKKDSFVSYSSIEKLSKKESSLDSESGSSSFDINELPKKLSGNWSSDNGFSGSLTDYMFASKMERPTFIIGESDTLVSIAEALYNNGCLAYLLAELNEDRTVQKRSKGGKLVVEARVRDILRLPVGEDIEEFESRDMKKYNPHNLITLVKDSPLKKEVLEDVLGQVVTPVCVVSSISRSPVTPVWARTGG